MVDLREVTSLGSTGLHLCVDLELGARRDGHEVLFVRPRDDAAWLPSTYADLADRLPFVALDGAG